jgi:hypothetical protein
VSFAAITLCVASQRVFIVFVVVVVVVVVYFVIDSVRKILDTPSYKHSKEVSILSQIIHFNSVFCFSHKEPTTCGVVGFL